MYETFKFENGLAIVMEICEIGDLSKIILNKKKKICYFQKMK